MPSDMSGTPGAGTATGTTSDEVATTTTQQTTQAPNREGALAELIASFRTELVDMRREFRNRLAPGRTAETATAPATQSTPTASGNATAPSQWDPMALLAFRDAVDEAGVAVTVPQRKMLEKLYRAEPGVSDPVSWVREQAEILGWRKPPVTPAATTPVTPPAAVKPPDTPAPTGTAVGGTSLPDDPALLPQSTIDAMTPEQARDHYLRWKQRNGAFRHPFASAREAERASGQDVALASAALRQVLAGNRDAKR